MKRHLKRLFIQYRLTALAAQLEGVAMERKYLDAFEQDLIVRANRARLELLMMDIKAQRHA